MPQGGVELCESVRYGHWPVVNGERVGLIWERWYLFVSIGKLVAELEKARKISGFLRMQS